MIYEKQRPGGFYAYPSHFRGVRGVWKRLVWWCGLDPLTIRQRLAQVRSEADDWKRWGDEFAGAVMVLWGDHRDEIRSEIERARSVVRPDPTRVVDGYGRRVAPVKDGEQ